jgi:hypothetical protein
MRQATSSGGQRSIVCAHGLEPMGLQAARALIVCGVLSSVAVGVIFSISRDRGEAIASTNEGASRTRSISRALPASSVSASGAPLDADFSVAQAAATWARRIPDELLERDLASADTENEMLQFGPVKIRRRLVETIVRAARRTGADPALLMAIADKESSFATGVKARTSSATGLFQFIEATWLRGVRTFGARHGLEIEAAEIEGPEERPVIVDAGERTRVLAMRLDPYLSALIAAEMLNHDGGLIARDIGRELTEGETYLTHFLGPNDATRFMDSVANQPTTVAATLLPRPARANAPIFFGRGRSKPLSVIAVRDKFEEMMGRRIERYADVKRIPDTTAYAE